MSLTPCPWCWRDVSVVLGGRICRHDNRNNSGFCKGSLCPAEADLNARAEADHG